MITTLESEINTTCRMTGKPTSQSAHPAKDLNVYRKVGTVQLSTFSSGRRPDRLAPVKFTLVNTALVRFALVS